MSGATHSVITAANLSGGAGTQLNATNAGQYVSYSGYVWEDGTYSVKGRVKIGPKRGTFQLSIDGVNQGNPQDEYSPSIAYATRGLGYITFKDRLDPFGSVVKSVFKFLSAGKNTNSSAMANG